MRISLFDRAAEQQPALLLRGMLQEGAKAAVRAFHKRHPRRRKEYDAKRPYKDRPLDRLRRKYPDLPTACESCGEDRVLEIAHRPGHERRGAWRVMSNCQRHMIWVLCPTCHKLLDKGICTPSELALE